MNNIWTETLQRVHEGARFAIDLRSRTLRLNSRTVIDRGVFQGESGLPPTDTLTAVREIEAHYQAYKHSLPSERSKARHRQYFKALREDELSDDDLLYGIPRESAQARLELHILLRTIDGSIDPDELFPSGHWFWQSASDPDLVILKDWLFPNN